MRGGVLLFAIAIGSILRGSELSLVDQSPCLGPGARAGSAEGEGDVSFLPMGDALLVLHTDYTWYCCLEASLKVEFSGEDIYLYEVNRDGICRCICTYNLWYVVPDIPPGTYTVHLVDHDGEEIAAEKLTFPSGSPWKRKVHVSECHQGKEAVEIEPGENSLNVVHRNLLGHCCPEFVVRHTVREDAIEIYEYDEAEAPCECACFLDLEVTVDNLPPGTYAVRVYGLDGTLRGEEKVEIPGEPLSEFVRGEVNGDGKIDIADPVFILSYLFASGPRVRCEDAADTNDDGKVDISDAVTLLLYLFGVRHSLPYPFPDPGYDLTGDDLGCR